VSAEEPRQYLIAHLQSALAHDERVNQLDIHVKIAAGKVFLTGSVPTYERYDAVSAIAAEVMTGHEVHNELKIASYGDPDDMEQLS
jgi:osmotically-inducible protein OsmY